MSQVFDFADEYVRTSAALDPFGATFSGVDGYDDQVPDYSPAGVEATFEARQRLQRRLQELTPTTDADRIAQAVMLDDLEQHRVAHESADWQSDLNIIASPTQSLRDVFDLMGADSEEHWTNRHARLEKLPAAIAGYRASLQAGLDHGHTAARRQATECATQCDVRSAQFATAVLEGSEALPATLRTKLEIAAAAAGSSYADLGKWLRNDYAPRATEHDGVGLERYQRDARRHVGSPIDPLDTYHWGLDQVASIRSHMERVADEILSGASIPEAIQLLERDPARCAEGEDALVRFLQHHMDSMLDHLDGTHFDIAPQARKVEQMIAPPGGASAQYYTPPSEDWSRPGRCWFPVNGKTHFPLWGEISTANHEGVPGHHLQMAAAMAAGEKLSRFQKLLFVPGHGEGWALYAERLCFELGLLDRPDYVLGWLNGQMLRAVRVVIDIGMHCGADLGLTVPNDAPVVAGQPWNAATGLAYAKHYVVSGVDLVSEVDRYLGWPGQAISYKVGEREWLRLRDDVRSQLGSAFDLKAFHTTTLGLGAMGLDLLRSETLRSFGLAGT